MISLECSQFFSYQNLKEEKTAVEVGQSLGWRLVFLRSVSAALSDLLGTAVEGTSLEYCYCSVC